MVKAYREVFRRIDRALWCRESSESSSVVQITSSHFGEGVTTITLAMALFMAESHDDVIAVEANLRRPSFSEMLGIEPAGSLEQVLEQSCSLERAIQRAAGYNFSILPAGPVSERQDHDVLLARLRTVLAELRNSYGYILVDSPPVISFDDASIISGVADCTVIVVASNSTRSEVLEHTIDMLKDANARMLGTLLNKREHHIPRWLYRLV